MHQCKSITIKKDFRTFKEGTVIQFKPGVTLLVGDQGTGKSSLLYLLNPSNKDKTKEHYSIDCEKVKCLFLDTEKDNPRIKSSIETRMFKLQVYSSFKSHGETMIVFFDLLNKSENSVVMIDEPESGLSIRSQYKLIKTIRESIDRNVQFIISTHSLILIEAFENIFDLEIMNYTTKEEFLERQKNNV